MLKGMHAKSVAGDVGIVGPALSVLDADIAAGPAGQQPGRPAGQRSGGAAEAKRAAQQAAPGQEARSMLGEAVIAAVTSCFQMHGEYLPASPAEHRCHGHKEFMASKHDIRVSQAPDGDAWVGLGRDCVQAIEGHAERRDRGKKAACRHHLWIGSHAEA